MKRIILFSAGMLAWLSLGVPAETGEKDKVKKPAVDMRVPLQPLWKGDTPG